MPCTTLLVGKKASYDGSTLVARNEDSGAGEFTPKKFIVVHPSEQPEVYKSVLSHVEIPLPKNPMRYTCMPDALNDKGIWGAAGVNELNVSMTATETITSNERVLAADPLVEYIPAQGKKGDEVYVPEVVGGIGEEDIVTLVLPYIKSAREGVLRLGEILEKYGTYEMNGIAFQDVDEIWWLETIGGHHWIAKRVKDDEYVVMPNQQGIDSFDLKDAASIGIIGAADGPTSILVSQVLNSSYIGPIAVAAYSYMALVPIIQPFAIKLVTTKKERQIRMSYNAKAIPKSTRIAFPIAVTMIVGFISPQSVALVGFLMFGNLLRECGVLNTLSQTAQDQLVNLITLLLGITISFSMQAEQFVNLQTIMILGLGLIAFVFDTMAGVLFAKLVNVVLAIMRKPLINPMIGGCGISAFPMSSRVVQKLANEESKGNIILMQAAGTNVAGQVASVIAGGLVISIVSRYL